MKDKEKLMGIGLILLVVIIGIWSFGNIIQDSKIKRCLEPYARDYCESKEYEFGEVSVCINSCIDGGAFFECISFEPCSERECGIRERYDFVHKYYFTNEELENCT